MTIPQVRDVYFSYDPRNLQTAARFDSTSGEGITNTYDGFGRLTSTSTNMGGNTRTLAYQYDRDGNRTRITHPDGNWFNTTYDGLDRPLLLQANGATTLAASQYYAHGGLYAVNRIATATEINYDLVQRPYVLHHYLPTAGDVYWVSQFNPAGQILSTVRTNDSYAWTGHYAVNRGYTTNGLNQYSQAGSTTLGYDANGNLITSGSNYYVYDIENRMVGAPNNVVLSYDPLGRLFQVSNTVSGVTTQFLYDGDAMVGEYNGSNVLQRRHVHNVGADVPIATYAVTAGTGLGTISQLFADRQGSIVAQLTSGGVNTGLNTYDEYGIPGVTNSGRFQYTGQIWLAEIGMYHYKARIYSPTLGRFMQTDPIGYEDQFNLYAYVGNDPVNGADPTGTTCVEMENGADCKIDNAGPLNPDELKQATRAYTDAVNTLLSDSTHRETITVEGIPIEVTAREVAEGLMRSDVHGGDDPGAAGQTVGGELHPEGATSDGRPIITINRVGLQMQDVGNGKFADRERARLFVHEGTHTVRQERAFVEIRDFNGAHRGAYRRSTEGFYGR